MTGEITLRGNVLPIGGLKEKIFAAHRGGIKKVIIPKENLKDLKDIPKNILKGLTIVDVTHMDQVLREALVTDEVFSQPTGSGGGSKEVTPLAADGQAGRAPQTPPISH